METNQSIQIYQEVELSLTESLIPTVVHVKQFDHRARKVRCILYNNSVEWAVPDGVVISCTGTRPDGAIFQYSSETSDLVFADNGAVIFTITNFMTRVFGRFPVDIALLSTDGDVLGSFSLVLKVERAAVTSRKISSLTYSGIVKAVEEGILGCFITEDDGKTEGGHFGIESEDGLGLSEESESTTVDKLLEEIVNATINDTGYLCFETEDGLKLVFSMDEEGHLVVEYGED